MKNMKSRDGKSQRREESEERERVRGKKIQAREEVGKSPNTVFSNDLRLRRVEK
jgi:hypothetical protein